MDSITSNSFVAMNTTTTTSNTTDHPVLIRGPNGGNPAAGLDYVGFFSVPFFLLIGVCGNVLTIIVMRSKPFSKFPSSLVLICLALSDTVLNVLLPFNKAWVNKLLGTDIRSYSDQHCQAFFWAFRTAKMTSSWCVVLICMERFVAVCLPLRAPVICRKRHAVIGISLIYVIIGTYNGVWVTFADQIVNGVCRPNTQPPGYVTINRTFLIVGLSIYSFVPCVILVSLTTAIIVALYRARSMRRAMMVMSTSASGSSSGGGGRGPGAFEDPTAKTTRMLVCIIVAFVLLVTPIALGHLIFFIRREPIFASQEKLVVVYREVATFLEHMNYSINFFLYVVACPSFRNHLPHIFHCDNLCGRCCWWRCIGGSSKLGSRENLALQDSTSSEKSSRTTSSSGGGVQSQSTTPRSPACNSEA